MKILPNLRWLACFIASAIGCLPGSGVADDIDIFVGSSAGQRDNPNVLIILDNTSNWSRQSQKWPEGEQQGQSEVAAIQTVIQTLNDQTNVGLMEFVTGAGANNNGGFIRQAIQPMSAANKASFSTTLTTIYNNIASPDEKRNSNTPYGNLMYDAYNYYAGANQSQEGAATLGIADANGYTANYSAFRSPVSCGTSCAKNFVIFISNPNASGPASDDATNTAALAAVGGNTVQLGLPNFTSSTTTQLSLLGNSSQCYANQAACNTALATAGNGDYTAYGCDAFSGGCSCGAAGIGATSSCPAGQQSYTVTGTTLGAPSYGAWNDQSCVPAASCVAPANTAAAQYQCVQSGCAAGYQRVQWRTVTANLGAWANSACLPQASCSAPADTSTAQYRCAASGCYAGENIVQTRSVTQNWNAWVSGVSYGTSNLCNAAKPADTAATEYQCLHSGPNYILQSRTLQGTEYGSWGDVAAACSGSCSAPANSATVNYQCTGSGCNGQNRILQHQTTATTYGAWADTATTCVDASAAAPADTATTGYQWTTTGCSSGKKLQARTITAAGTPTTLGTTTSCYADAASCTAAYACPAQYTGGCACGAPTANTYPSCGATGDKFQVYENDRFLQNTPTGTYTTDSNPFNADEWSRLLYQKGIPIAGCSSQTVSTYTIDVYNAQPNAQNTSLMLSMARNGGGKYFNATNKSALVNALKQIFVEIQSINSTFASASLPINATNRAQNANQVFIGMFRPDPDAKPRWFGNLKRYQLVADSGGDIQLGDFNGALAINNNTGFISDCARSWWTSDSGAYWANYPITPNPAGACTTTAFNAYSDAPDGPRVEKGAVAQVLRKGNVSNAADAAGGATADTTVPTWAVNRTVYTASGTTRQEFSVANTGLSDTLVDWVLGKDTEGESLAGASANTRASLHGDVVHSRPLAVNYCTGANCSNTVIYYGANDGSLRAVDSGSGREKWAFIAPESLGTLDRLRTQSPLVNYPGASFPAGLTPSPTRRDYFMDGSLGLYQNADNTKVWIYPTMRRGGRMIYGLDVTDSASPAILWKFGCPNLANDTGCTAGASAIGQTWSVPNVGFIKGYSTVSPVIVVGGGYDSCEDADSAAPACGSTKGNVVYVLNAQTGAVLASFATLRSVAADVALIDIDSDGFVDYAYVADTGGNLYRLNLSSWDSATGTSSPLAAGSWTLSRIAYTAGGGRKFLFAPSIFGAKGIVYVALGSGDREHPLQSNYPYASNVANRFYVYRECLPASPAASSLADGTNLDDPALMNQTSATNPAPCAQQQTLASNCASNKGWFMDLNNGRGEQTVTSAAISGGMVTFSTNRAIAAAAGTCSTALGEARGYWVDLFKGSGAIATTGDATCGGLASTTFVGGGLPPSPIIATVPINGVPVSVVIGAAQRTGIASSSIAPQRATATNLPARKRVYTIIKGDN